MGALNRYRARSVNNTQKAGATTSAFVIIVEPFTDVTDVAVWKVDTQRGSWRASPSLYGTQAGILVAAQSADSRGNVRPTSTRQYLENSQCTL